MLGVSRTINNFKLNYSQALSRAALAKGETTWQLSEPSGRIFIQESRWFGGATR